MTYFPTFQCLRSCSCCCWKSLTQVHWDFACVGLHTWWVGNREFPVAQSHLGAQTVWHPWEAAMLPSLQRQPPLCPSNAALPEILLSQLVAPGLEQHCCLHPKQPQAQAGTTFLSTRWELGNHGSLQISLVAIFGGRIDLEVLAHIIGQVIPRMIWKLKST